MRARCPDCSRAKKERYGERYGAGGGTGGGHGYTRDDDGSKPIDVAWVEAKLGERDRAKKSHDFSTADAVREELRARGVEVHDLQKTWHVKGAPRRPGGGGSGGARAEGGREGAAPAIDGPVRCFNCGKNGHVSRDCPNKLMADKCYHCGKTGHFSRNCPTTPNVSVCFQCGKPGHMSRDCPTTSWK